MQKLIFLPYKDLNIKNIIFDLGGVILNIDYHLTIDAFKKLGFDDFDTLFTQARQTGVFDKLDKGLVTPDEFRNGIRDLAKKKLTDEQINYAWNAMLLDFPVHRLKLLEQIHSQYETYLLSNTNQIHIEVYNQILFNTFGVKNLSPFFNKEYYSHVIHMRKPDAEVYELILNQNGLKAEETLFIDDSEHHIVGARKVGLNAYHLNLKEGETIEELFKEFSY
jgi:putative hydrolase of the HAD superfamily